MGKCFIDGEHKNVKSEPINNGYVPATTMCKVLRNPAKITSPENTFTTRKSKAKKSKGTSAGTAYSVANGKSIAISSFNVHGEAIIPIFINGIATSLGDSIASGIGKITINSVGTGSSTSDTSCVGKSLFNSYGSMPATSSSSGVKKAIANSVGTAVGTSTGSSVPIVSSITQHMSLAVDSRIAGKTVSVAKLVYSSIDHSTPVYVRNTECWAYDLDLTFHAPSFDDAGSGNIANVFGINMITPKHGLSCMHFGTNLGSIFRFVGLDNTVYYRTVVANKIQVGSSDLGLVVLDSDLPSEIKPVKLMPSTIGSKVWDSNTKVPMFCIEQNSYCLICETTVGFASSYLHNATLSWGWTPSGDRLGYQKPSPGYLVGGDSGSPFCVIINNEPVLVSEATFVSSGYGVAYNNTNIQAAIDTLSPGEGYTPTYADISEFN